MSLLDEMSLYGHDGKKKSQSTLLIEIGKQLVLFHDNIGNGYAEISINGAAATYKIKSKDFREYLSRRLYLLTDKGANATAITDAIATLEAVARNDGKQKIVAVRVHQHDDAVYIDAGLDDWRQIKITAEGWKFIELSPIRFIRKNGMTALPAPAECSNLELLHNYINVRKEESALIIGWLFCALSGVKPYPILILQGEQGTGKSTTSKVLRSFVDPSSVPLRTPPKDKRDLLVSAGNNHCVVLDNLSGISPDIADTLCRLSTGGGIDMRALYTDDEQHLIELQKPVVVNGIDDIATRPDLAERSLIINLPVISSTERRSEQQFWQDFERDRSLIFSALLSGIASGLKCYDQIELKEKPRMVDVAHFVTACERGLDIEGAFLAAHTKNQLHAVELAIEASPVGNAITELMQIHNNWTGKPTELLSELTEITEERVTRSKAWPLSTKGLSNAIKRLMPNFRKVGIHISDGRTFAGRFYKIENVSFYPSYPSQVSQPTAGKGLNNDGCKAYPSHMTDTNSIRHGCRPELAGIMTDMTDMTDRNQKFLKGDDWEGF